MAAKKSRDLGLRAAGYEALRARYGLDAMPNWHVSYVGGATRRIHRLGDGVEETYPIGYWPGEGLGDHLEFALKYDGTNLALLARVFEAVDATELANLIGSKGTGKYARRLWYLYELVTGRRLPLRDLKRGNYVDLLEPAAYYTDPAPRRVRRQRINENLLGDRRFCPMIRRTSILEAHEDADLAAQCREIVGDVPPELLRRALRYLYTKETRSSHEIERIQPSSTRIERFVALLKLAEHEDFCVKDRLVDLQNRVVDPRFRDSDYRTFQNYVGQTVAWQREQVDYASPRPQDVADLMAGLIAAHARMADGAVSPVVHAAAVAYGFVFIHPFGDGNGRIHRFLIHNVLARRGFTPAGIMFPVSATMLAHESEYDASLEAFSRPLMALVDYHLDSEGHMTVENDTALWYRYADMTAQAEALFGFVRETIDTDLREELRFLVNYDEAKRGMQRVVDLPDREIDLFIRFCLQNHGRLSVGKRGTHFAYLTADEAACLEQAVQQAYGTP